MVVQEEKKPMFEGGRLLVIGDPGFPLERTYAPRFPERIWYRGTFRKCDALGVAVVGSRSCTELGAKRAFRFSKELAESGVTVISGLARGIDGAAHRGALAGGGRTLAVLGTGLNRIYPQEHEDLARMIERQGALLSQFASDSVTSRSPNYSGSRGGRNFLKRNVVVAGLAQVLVVVEAKERSGSLSAVRAAIAQERPVGLLWSLVESELWAQKLVQSGMAFVVKSVDDVMGRLEL